MEPSTGTTIVAVACRDGVVLGADSRVSMGAYVSNRASQKLAQLTDNVWLLRSGSAADTQAVADYVRYGAGQLAMDLGAQPSVSSVARLAKQINYNNKQLSSALIVAGWDSVGGGQVYCVPIGGTIVQEPWAADGSGSIFLLGLMDSKFREDMTTQEAESLVATALAHAMGRDGSSGGLIRLVTCSKAGSTKQLLQGSQIKQTWDEALNS